MDVFEISLEAINNNARQLETVSQNISNINTPGYLKAVPFAHYIDEQKQTITGEQVSLQGGTVRETGRDLDVAVLDGGFFQVELNQQQYITRGGHFYLNSEGFLMHPSGAYVLGEAGRISVSGKDIIVQADGTINSGGVDVARLLVVKPQSNSQIRPVGDGLYQTGLGQLQPINARVTQKAINSANVNPSEEMVRMIEISRHLQTTQKMVNAYDQLLNVGINELGKK